MKKKFVNPLLDMIVKNIYKMTLQEESAHKGKGTIKVIRSFDVTDFDSSWHFVDYAVIPPGSSIGRHAHGDDEELYFIIDGSGTMTVNDEIRRVSKGDLILNKRNMTHGLENDSNVDLHILVVEVGIK